MGPNAFSFLNDDQRDALLRQPDSGMGYQVHVDGKRRIVFLNAEIAFVEPLMKWDGMSFCNPSVNSFAK